MTQITRDIPTSSEGWTPHLIRPQPVRETSQEVWENHLRDRYATVRGNLAKSWASSEIPTEWRDAWLVAYWLTHPIEGIDFAYAFVDSVWDDFAPLFDLGVPGAVAGALAAERSMRYLDDVFRPVHHNECSRHGCSHQSDTEERP